jgi:hypothetical protein
MNAVDDFKYYIDKQNVAHSAGYLFNEQCNVAGNQKGAQIGAQKGGGFGLKDLAIPGGLFWVNDSHPPKHKVEKKGVVDESLFDKLFGCGCVEEKSGKKYTRRATQKKPKNHRKTKRT